jgi:hypothetical protein
MIKREPRFPQFNDIHGHSCDSADDRRIDRVAHLLCTAIRLLRRNENEEVSFAKITA